jgi:hypothetical protein
LPCSGSTSSRPPKSGLRAEPGSQRLTTTIWVARRFKPMRVPAGSVFRVPEPFDLRLPNPKPHEPPMRGLRTPA